MHAIYCGANRSLLEFGALRVLVDPWLTGPLRFPPGAWFFEGQLPMSQPVPAELDLLLLTQGLDDHTHPDTLKLLPRSLPVVDLGLLVAGAFVRGRTVLPQLVERFTPRRVLASTAGGDVRFSGLLTRLL